MKSLFLNPTLLSLLFLPMFISGGAALAGPSSGSGGVGLAGSTMDNPETSRYEYLLQATKVRQKDTVLLVNPDQSILALAHQHGGVGYYYRSEYIKSALENASKSGMMVIEVNGDTNKMFDKAIEHFNRKKQGASPPNGSKAATLAYQQLRQKTEDRTFYEQTASRIEEVLGKISTRAHGEWGYEISTSVDDQGEPEDKVNVTLIENGFRSSPIEIRGKLQLRAINRLLDVYKMPLIKPVKMVSSQKKGKKKDETEAWTDEEKAQTIETILDSGRKLQIHLRGTNQVEFVVFPNGAGQPVTNLVTMKKLRTEPQDESESVAQTSSAVQATPAQ